MVMSKMAKADIGMDLCCSSPSPCEAFEADLPDGCEVAIDEGHHGLPSKFFR